MTIFPRQLLVALLSFGQAVVSAPVYGNSLSVDDLLYSDKVRDATSMQDPLSYLPDFSQTQQDREICGLFGTKYTGILIAAQVSERASSAPQDHEDMFSYLETAPYNVEIKIYGCRDGWATTNRVYFADREPQTREGKEPKHTVPWGRVFCLANDENGSKRATDPDDCFVFARRRSQCYNPFDVTVPNTWVGGLFKCKPSGSKPLVCQNTDAEPLWPVYATEFRPQFGFGNKAGKGFVYSPLFATLSNAQAHELVASQSGTRPQTEIDGLDPKLNQTGNSTQNDTKTFDTHSSSRTDWSSMADSKYVPENWDEYIDTTEQYVEINKSVKRFILDTTFKVFRKILHWIHIFTKIPSIAAYHLPETNPQDINMLGSDMDWEKGPQITSPITVENLIFMGFKTPEYLTSQVTDELYNYETRLYVVAKELDRPIYQHAAKGWQSGWCSASDHELNK